MERSLWTDERLDDAISRIEQQFAQVGRNFDRVWERFDQVDRKFERVDQNFDRVWDEFRVVHSGVASTRRLLAQIGWGLVGALFIQLIAAIVAFS